jgi:hypothetical protein
MTDRAGRSTCGVDALVGFTVRAQRFADDGRPARTVTAGVQVPPPTRERTFY